MEIYQKVMATFSTQSAFDVPVEYLEIRTVEGTIEAQKKTMVARTSWPVVRSTIFYENNIIEDAEVVILAAEVPEGATIRDESHVFTIAPSKKKHSTFVAAEDDDAGDDDDDDAGDDDDDDEDNNVITMLFIPKSGPCRI